MKINEINGYKVLTHNNRHKLSRIQVVVNAGSFNETEESIYGAAHYLEHMAFKGTEFNDYKYINKQTSRLGNINAATAEDRTIYYINCRSENVNEVIDLLLEMLFYPKFDIDEFNKERTVILEEYKSRMCDPDCFFWDKLTEVFRNAHRVIGTNESITNMTIYGIKEFRKKNYTKSNILFTVVGGIDEEEVNKRFKIYFNSVDEMLDRCPDLTVSRLNESVDLSEGLNILDLSENMEDSNFSHNSSQAYVALVTNGITTTENYNKNYVGSVFSNALGGGMHSLLFDRIREELGYCYNTGIYWSSHNNQTSDYILYAALDKKNVTKTIEEMQNILKSVKENGISEDLLSTAKENCLYYMSAQHETSSGISAMLTGYFGFNKFVELDEKIKKIKSITNKDIKEFANEYMNTFKLVIMNGKKE